MAESAKTRGLLARIMELSHRALEQNHKANKMRTGSKGKIGLYRAAENNHRKAESLRRLRNSLLDKK